MKAKTPKCACLGLQSSTGKKIDSHLSLNNQQVPYTPQGVKFARSANSSLLFLSGRNGGLNLPLPSTMHKRLQVSRLSLLLTSPDPCVRLMAENSSRKGLTTSRPKFKANQEVRGVMIQNPDFTRKSLNKAAKLLVSEGDEDQYLTSLQRLEKQGHMSRCSSPDGAHPLMK